MENVQSHSTYADGACVCARNQQNIVWCVKYHHSDASYHAWSFTCPSPLPCACALCSIWVVSDGPAGASTSTPALRKLQTTGGINTGTGTGTGSTSVGQGKGENGTPQMYRSVSTGPGR